MTLAIPNDAWVNKPNEGDEIVIFDEEGLLVGNDKYRENASVIVIWGNDELTHIKDGLFEGEKFTIKLFRVGEDNLENITVDYWKEGSGLYNTNGISIVGAVRHEPFTSKELIKVTDLIGREVNPNSKEGVFLYIYIDGTVEKKYPIK